MHSVEIAGTTDLVVNEQKEKSEAYPLRQILAVGAAVGTLLLIASLRKEEGGGDDEKYRVEDQEARDKEAAEELKNAANNPDEIARIKEQYGF